MAGVKSTGEYDYIEPDEKSEYRKKVDPATQFVSNYIFTGIDFKEYFKDKDSKAKPTKKNTRTHATKSFKGDIVLSTDLFEGMSIKASDNKEMER